MTYGVYPPFSPAVNTYYILSPNLLGKSELFVIVIVVVYVCV